MSYCLSFVVSGSQALRQASTQSRARVNVKRKSSTKVNKVNKRQRGSTRINEGQRKVYRRWEDKEKRDRGEKSKNWKRGEGAERGEGVEKIRGEAREVHGWKI